MYFPHKAHNCLSCDEGFIIKSNLRKHLEKNCAACEIESSKSQTQESL